MTQADGKVVGVTSVRVDENPDRRPLYRLLENGTPDPTFGSGGFQFYRTSDTRGTPYAIAIQPDGKLLALGVEYGAGTFLARYNQDGSPDTSFGVGGRVIGVPLNLTTFFVDVLQIDTIAGRAVVAAVASGADPDGSLAVVRYWL